MLSASKILFKGSNVPGRVPALSSLELRELAINTADGTIFVKNEQNQILTFEDRSKSPFTLDQTLSSINTSFVDSNTITEVFGTVLNGYNNSISGAGSTILNGENNAVAGDFGLIGGGLNNTIGVNGDGGAIIGGSNNTLNHPESFILGSNISSHLSGFTYVNNLTAVGKIYGDGSELTGIVAGDTEATTLVRSNSAKWESVYTTFKDASSTFLTSETDSQTLSFNEGTKELTISAGNTVSLSALGGGGGGSGDENVNTLVRSNSATWDNASTVVAANSGMWTPIRKFDMVYSPNTASYSGTAPNGSLTSQSVWTIVRIVYTTSGTVSAQGIANNAIWDNRLSLTYV